jgi:hypothetical protein
MRQILCDECGDEIPGDGISLSARFVTAHPMGGTTSKDDTLDICSAHCLMLVAPRLVRQGRRFEPEEK